MSTFKAVALGIVGVAMATALFMPGRTTVAFTQAAGTAGTNILGTAIKG